jgi:hypothetical protein
MTQWRGRKRWSANAALGDGLAMAERQLGQTALMSAYVSTPPSVERTQ